MKTLFLCYLSLRNLSRYHIWSDICYTVEMLMLWFMTSEPEKRGKNRSPWGMYICTIVYIFIILDTHRNEHIAKRNHDLYVHTCPLLLL